MRHPNPFIPQPVSLFPYLATSRPRGSSRKGTALHPNPYIQTAPNYTPTLHNNAQLHPNYSYTPTPSPLNSYPSTLTMRLLGPGAVRARVRPNPLTPQPFTQNT